MAQNSKIEWTDHTLNLWHGCTKVHEGCDNCYAEALAKRWGNDIWGNDKPRKEIKSAFRELDKMQTIAKKEGKIHRVFVGSMMDIFEKPMPLIGNENENTGNLRFQLFYRIDRGDYPNLLFLFLTKRPSNINKYIFESWKENPPENVMFGTSPVNQETAYTLINQLLKVKGRKFLSVEPQLGSVNLVHWLPEIDWVIQGGESGHHKRPFDLNWAFDLKEQCQTANVPYFFKQIDKVKEIPNDLLVREFPIMTVGSAFR